MDASERPSGRRGSPERAPGARPRREETPGNSAPPNHRHGGNGPGGRRGPGQGGGPGPGGGGGPGGPHSRGPRSGGPGSGGPGKSESKGGQGGGPGPGSGRGPGMGQGRPSGPVGPILRRLLGYMRPHSRSVAAVSAALLVTTAIERLRRSSSAEGGSPHPRATRPASGGWRPGILGLTWCGGDRLPPPLPDGRHGATDRL